jgi:acyl-CoA thioester hydrolase
VYTPEKFEHKTTTRVRFAEVDGQRLLYHGQYVEYMDMGLQDYWRSCGLYSSINLDVDPVFHVVHVEVDYIRSIVLDELIDICVRIDQIRSTSIHFEFALHGHAKNDLRATGREVHVHVDRSTGRPSSVPAGIRDLVEAFEGECSRGS